MKLSEPAKHVIALIVTGLFMVLIILITGLVFKNATKSIQTEKTN